MLRKLMEDGNPDYVAVAFDSPQPTFRHQRYELYKAHRKPMPEALADQIPWIKRILAAYRIPIFEQAGYEADDILGTLAVQGAKQGFSVYLVTGDKDLFQLIGDKIRVWKPMKDGYEIVDEELLQTRWGIRPSQVADAMALMGDETDAIPGVPGIGEKTAVALIREYGSLEDLLREVDEGKGDLKPAIAKAIQTHREQLTLSRQLAGLDTSVPLRIEWETLRRSPPDRAELRRIFQTLEFRTLLKELDEEEPIVSQSSSTQPLPIEVCEIESGDQLKWYLTQRCRSGRVALVPVWEEGASPMQAEMIGLGLAWEEGTSAFVEREKVGQILHVLGRMEGLLKVCPNLKETVLGYLRLGIPYRGRWMDPTLASYLLDPTRPSHHVEDLGMEFLGLSPPPSSTSTPLRASIQAHLAWRLAPRMEEEIERAGMSTLFDEVEIPLAFVLARMEHEGIGFDEQALNDLKKEVERRLDALTHEIYRLSGGPFNLNSPKQLAKVLFGDLKLPVIKRTKTGPSTDEEVLRHLSLMHELPGKLLEYRELAKFDSTYLKALPQSVHPQTGRIHASFHQTVTATGRLSASNPNLQNIPIRTELGRQIRKAFVPRPTWLFLSADYSQIELRILAHLSGDDALVEAFQRGEDIHCATASTLFGVALDKVTAEQRAVAKTINFGLIYGMTAFGLAKELRIDQKRAEEFIERYFAQYPKLKQYLEDSLKEAQQRGYCLTLLNRRRTIPELSAKEPTVRQFAQRMAINAPIQGSAADLIKVAMVNLDQAILERGWSARLVCQIHDELILELPKEEVGEVEALVRQTMEMPVLCGQPIRLRIPLRVNVRTGRNWYEASH